MKRYAVDVKLVGYEEVWVDADSKEEALEKAHARFWEIYSVTPAASLRMKSAVLTVVNKWKLPKEA
jgi:ribosomal protein L19E